MRIPGYRLHPSSGQARVTLNGRDHLLGPYGSPESKEKYGRLIAEYAASGNSKNFGKPDSFLIEDLVLAYLKHAEEYYAGSTEFKNMKLVVRPLVDIYGTMPASKLGPFQYRAVRSKWLEDPKRSRQYINKQMKRLLSVLKWGASLGYITGENFIGCQCVEPLKRGRVAGLRESKAIQPVSDDVVEKTLLHTTKVVGDMIQFQRLTGCRPGEVCLISPSMVDRSKEVWLVELDKHKTFYRGKKRIIFVGPKAQQVLLPYLQRSDHEPCFSPVESEQQRLAAKHAARKTPMSCGNVPGSNRSRKPRKSPSNQFSAGTYARSIRNVCERENITMWSPGQLRHTAATQIRKQHGLETSQVVLGHSTAAVTQIYAERDLERGAQWALKHG